MTFRCLWIAFHYSSDTIILPQVDEHILKAVHVKFYSDYDAPRFRDQCVTQVRFLAAKTGIAEFARQFQTYDHHLTRAQRQRIRATNVAFLGGWVWGAPGCDCRYIV